SAPDPLPSSFQPTEIPPNRRPCSPRFDWQARLAAPDQLRDRAGFDLIGSPIGCPGPRVRAGGRAGGGIALGFQRVRSLCRRVGFCHGGERLPEAAPEGVPCAL
ncbi:Ubiquitin-conjugating enzyme E2 34, partial [Zea mays]